MKFALRIAAAFALPAALCLTGVAAADPMAAAPSSSAPMSASPMSAGPMSPSPMAASPMAMGADAMAKPKMKAHPKKKKTPAGAMGTDAMSSTGAMGH